MTPTPEELADPQKAGWRYIGGGLFSTVYSKEQMVPEPLSFFDPNVMPSAMIVARRENIVLKVASCADGTMDFIEWCYLRMRKFGKGSAEMSGLPEVEAFGRTEQRNTNARSLVYGEDSGEATQGWWCIMPEYESARDYSVNDMRTACSALIARLDEIFYRGFCNDLHAGNFMVDRKRGQFVIIDPCKDGAKETASQRRQDGFSVSTALIQRPMGAQNIPKALGIERCNCPMCQPRPRFDMRGLDALERELLAPAAPAEERQIMKMANFGRRFGVKKFGGFSIKPMAFAEMEKYVLADMKLLDDLLPAAVPVKADPKPPVAWNPKPRRIADWKLPQLQRQHHMR